MMGTVHARALIIPERSRERNRPARTYRTCVVLPLCDGRLSRKGRLDNAPKSALHITNDFFFYLENLVVEEDHDDARNIKGRKRRIDDKISVVKCAIGRYSTVRVVQSEHYR